MAQPLKAGFDALARRVFHRLPPRAQAEVRRLVHPVRLRHPVRWGTFRRLSPLDPSYGYARGTPIGRRYVDEFVERCGHDIRGHVLEVGQPMYAAGREDRVERLDIVDVDPYNPDATVLADLSDPASLPAAAFDCVILTQTLQYVADFEAAMENVWQALRPGGVALISVPAVSRRDIQLADVDRWRFLPNGLATLLARTCRGASVEIIPFGNLLVAMSSLHGIAAEELRPEELTWHDAAFPTITCARVRKCLEPC